MKIRLSRRSPPSSKTASKRIKGFALPPYLPFICLLLILLPVRAPAQEQPSATLRTLNGEIRLRISADQEGTSDLRAALDEGAEAEIRFRIRLYRERRGLGTLLGDALLYEHTTVRTASQDLFSDGYLLQGPEGERRFSDFEAFLQAFTILNHRFSRSRIPDGVEAELLYQVITVPRRLVPPFTLLRPFVPGIEHSSPWMRVSLIPAEGARR